MNFNLHAEKCNVFAQLETLGKIELQNELIKLYTMVNKPFEKRQEQEKKDELLRHYRNQLQQNLTNLLSNATVIGDVEVIGAVRFSREHEVNILIEQEECAHRLLN